MTAKEVAALVGQHGQFHIQLGQHRDVPMSFPIVILDARGAVNRTDLYIKSVGGFGRAWVSLDRVALDP